MTLRSETRTGWAVAAALALALPSVALATQSLSDGVFELRGLHRVSRPGMAEVTEGTQRGQWASPGPMIRPDRATLYSERNDNSAYVLDVRRRVPSRRACEGGLLSLDGRLVVTSSYSVEDHACGLFFRIDRAMADLAATRLHLRRQDRSPVGESMVGAFHSDREHYASRGDDVVIVLTLANPAGAPLVRWQRGGRQRGARDNQWSFRITRDGQTVTPIDAPDFGGPTGFLDLGPGGQTEIRTSLAPWGDVTVPGRYVVECSFETVLMPEGAQPWTDASRGAMWDRTFTGRASFDVR